VIALLTILAVPLSTVAPASTPDVQLTAEPITISADTTPQDLIEAARADLAQKHWSAAAARLAAARARLEAPPPVLAYDQGVAATNAGDLAGAAAAFDAAMKTASDPQLAADAAYNLGNVAHQLIAQQQTDQTQQAGQQHGAAMDTLEEALTHYRTAIAQQPGNADARANAQLTWQRLQELKQQQEQQQDQQGEQDQPPDQQQEQDQQGDQDQDQDQQQQNEQDQQGEQDQQQQQEQSAGQEQQPDQQNQQQQEPAAQPAAPKELSREEAQRLLQRVRDREREQAQQETKETPGRSVTGKDW